MQTLVELKGTGFTATLRLPLKFDPARAWPLHLHSDGDDPEALVLTAPSEAGEQAKALVKTLYPVALTEGEKPQETTLTVEVTGLRSTKGQVVYSLFSGPDGFPDKGEKAVARGVCAPTDEKTARFTIPKLPPGVYAVTLFHDENSNGKLDTKTFGIPKEGFGFSNNPKIRLGPPRFKEASFAITGAGPERTLRIKLTHL